MKRSVLIFSLLVGLFFTACSSNDDGGNKINTPPTAVALEIAEEDTNSSIRFSWNASIDADCDNVTYDFYVNDEVLVANLTTLQYVWEIDGTENYKYPATFKVIAKDTNAGSSESNDVSVQDPLIGEWGLERIVSDGVEEGLTDCDKLSVVEFIAGGIYNAVDRYIDGDNCESDSYSGAWENLNNGEYSFLLDGEMVAEINSAIF